MNLAKCLTFFGAVPFVTASGLLIAGVESLPWLGSVAEALRIYSLVIAAFLCGSNWTRDVAANSHAKLVLAIFSNVLAVAIWLFALFLSFEAQLIAYAACFLSLLGAEYYSLKVGQISEGYFRLRIQITALVVACLVATALVLLSL